MALTQDAPNVNEANLDQLRHDLVNPLNVLMGAATALLQTDLTDAQRAWVEMVQSNASELLQIVNNINTSADTPLRKGRAKLADLCSIAVARVGKPFDRLQLIEAIEQVCGDRPLRILLVDDSPELALLVRTYLAGTGWDLEVVEDGERAVVQATTERYDVVLMDIDLPGIDGATAAHAIRATDLARGASPTPIIAMTVFDSDSASNAEQPEDATRQDPAIAPRVSDFLAQRRADVSIFHDALKTRAYDRIQSCARRMKGTGRGHGFTTVSRIAADLEIAADHQDRTRVAGLIDELETYLASITIE
jgi:CheY-like chemotaxis protein